MNWESWNTSCAQRKKKYIARSKYLLLSNSFYLFLSLSFDLHPYWPAAFNNIVQIKRWTIGLKRSTMVYPWCTKQIDSCTILSRVRCKSARAIEAIFRIIPFHWIISNDYRPECYSKLEKKTFFSFFLDYFWLLSLLLFDNNR